MEVRPSLVDEKRKPFPLEVVGGQGCSLHLLAGGGLAELVDGIRPQGGRYLFWMSAHFPARPRTLTDAEEEEAVTAMIVCGLLEEWKSLAMVVCSSCLLFWGSPPIRQGQGHTRQQWR